MSGVKQGLTALAESHASEVAAVERRDCEGSELGSVRHSFTVSHETTCKSSSSLFSHSFDWEVANPALAATTPVHLCTQSESCRLQQ